MSSLPGHLRPRTFFELLDESVRHYRTRFFALVLLFVPVGVLDLLNGVLSAVVQTNLTADDPGALGDILSFGFVMFLLGVVQGVAGLLAYGASIHLAAADLLGRRLPPRGAWMESSTRFWAMLGLGVLGSMLIGFGFMFFVIPGFYLAVRFGVSAQALLLEGKNVGDALGRSGELVRGQYGRGLGIVLFIAVLSFSMSFVPAGFGAAGILFLDEQGEIGNPVGFILVLALGQAVASTISIVLAPLASLLATHFYWDLRVRKEGLDLDTRLRRLESPVEAASG